MSAYNLIAIFWEVLKGISVQVFVVGVIVFKISLFIVFWVTFLNW